jgi:hypothetical protein
VQPLQALQAAPGQGVELRAVMDALRAIDARLQKLEAQGGQAQPLKKQSNLKTDAPPAVALVAKNKCAVCHSEAKASDEGGNHVLFKGDDLVPLSPRQHDRLRTKCYDREMPPKDNKYKIEPLTDAELASLADWPKKT